MSKTYKTPEAGEWVQPVAEGYKMECCDCGLVHTMDFRIMDGRVQFRVFRNNRATAQIRRHQIIGYQPTILGNVDPAEPTERSPR